VTAIKTSGRRARRRAERLRDDPGPAPNAGRSAWTPAAIVDFRRRSAIETGNCGTSCRTASWNFSARAGFGSKAFRTDSRICQTPTGAQYSLVAWRTTNTEGAVDPTTASSASVSSNRVHADSMWSEA
jgi:hypothetical protein